MTTETSKVVHSPGGVNGASCGAPFTADIRFTAKPSKVTCPACLTAMGEPRVVSGTDAVAATVAKPDHVAVGQRWRDRLGEYEVVAPATWGWRIRYDKRPDVLFKRAAVAILAEEYLEMAPVETPPPEWPCADCGANVAKVNRSAPRPTCDACWNKAAPAETPAPPGPAPAPPRHVTKAEGDCVSYCAGCRWRRARGIPTDWEPVAPAAPAPGVREDRDMGFAEACAALSEGAEVEWRGYSGAEWNRLFDGEWNAAGIAAWSSTAYEFRRRPEPLPAPKPGKLDGLVDEWCDRDAPMPMDLARDVAREALACVRRHDGDLDAAALELLGAEAGK